MSPADEEAWRLRFESGRVGFLLDAARQRRRDRRLDAVLLALCVLCLAGAVVAVVLAARALP